MNTNSNGEPHDAPACGRFPPASRPNERRAAHERERAFAYRFPRDARKLGGKFSVAENARRLLRYFYFERRLAQAVGAWTLAIPEFEVKVEAGRHLFYHADAAYALRERLREQEQGQTAIDQFRDTPIDRFIEELLSAADAPELLVGLHQVAGRALATAYSHHIDDTDPVADAPTIRLLGRILLDYRPMLAWAEEAIAAYVAGGVDEGRLAAWRWHLERLLAHIGGVSGAETPADEPRPLRCDQRPFVLRTQRDEVDAIEAFGTFLWDIRFQDFQAEYDLARITWDEARHTEIGHRALLAAGYDPFELPNRLTGSTCRGPMEPAYAMAEINLFGEVGVIKTIGGLIEQARENHDDLLVHVADFIRADERTHVRKGQHIIRVMTGQGMQDLEQRTRELFTECLVSLGAVTLDMDVFTVSREDIERLVGE